MKLDNNQQAFFALVKAGLWNREVALSPYGPIDCSVIYNMAEEQSVVGLITAGLDKVQDVKVPQEWTLQFIGSTLQIEQRNKAMNDFVAKLIEGLRTYGVYTLLVKGQGIAQCYEKPLWRASGDVDLLLSETNYEKAKEVLLPLAVEAELEDKSLKHYGMTLSEGYVVELHGTLHSDLSRRIDKVIDEVQRDVFYNGSVRSWQNGRTQVFLPAANNDVVFVFTHILQHFFNGGIGLRQLCDWCRLLWTYRESLNYSLLEKRLRKAGLMDKWKSFAAFAVNWLGMPENAMPFYQTGYRWSRKADRIVSIVLDSGNFGHCREEIVNNKDSVLKRSISSFWWFTKISLKRFSVFPLDAVKGWGRLMVSGLQATIRKTRKIR